MHRSSDRKAADQLLRYIDVPTVGYTNSSICEDDSNTTNICAEIIKRCNPIKRVGGYNDLCTHSFDNVQYFSHN